jgi:ATP-dependent exoDNAse (exonuclease V) beta subunit
MTRARDALVIPVFPKPARDSLQQDLRHVIPVVPEFGKVHNGWLVIDGRQLPRATGEAQPVRLKLPDGPTLEGEALARARQAWLGARESALRGAGAADPVQNPSEDVDHVALRALQEKGASLEEAPGGRSLGRLVHAVLAAIPLDRPDLADGFAAYFARKSGAEESVARRAAALVRRALASENVARAPRGRVYREVPFASFGSDGTIEGAIDMLIAPAEGATVIDFKTDAVREEHREAVQLLYSVQLEEYVAVARQAVGPEVAGRLVFLQLDENTNGAESERNIS